MRKRGVRTLVLGVTTGLAVVALPAQAMAGSSSTVEHFQIAIDSPTGGPVLAYGLFNAQGLDREHPTTTRTGFSTFEFRDGNITVKHTDDPGGTTTLDRKTCVAHIAATGDYVFKGGTGAYQKIDGHGDYTVDGTAVFAHTATGCGRQPIGEILLVDASGPASFDS
jgi:hypothetical protein